MKRNLMAEELIALLAVAVLLAVATRAYAHTNEFREIVAGVEQQYAIHPDHIPFSGLISFGARVYTRDGVKGLRIADFENIHRVDGAALDAFLQAKLGGSWHPFVKTHEPNDDTFIYVCTEPQGDDFRMVIADSEANELTLLEVKLSKRGITAFVDHPHGGKNAYAESSDTP